MSRLWAWPPHPSAVSYRIHNWTLGQIYSPWPQHLECENYLRNWCNYIKTFKSQVQKTFYCYSKNPPTQFPAASYELGVHGSGSFSSHAVYLLLQRSNFVTLQSLCLWKCEKAHVHLGTLKVHYRWLVIQWLSLGLWTILFFLQNFRKSFIPPERITQSELKGGNLILTWMLVKLHCGYKFCGIPLYLQ